MGKPNPFTAKAKKPNPFSAKARRAEPAKARKVNGADTKKKLSPFTLKAKLSQERKAALEKVEARSAEYTSALDEAAKLFKKLDRLDKPRKRDTQAFVEAKEAWLIAERKVDRAYNNLHGAIAVTKYQSR